MCIHECVHMNVYTYAHISKALLRVVDTQGQLFMHVELHSFNTLVTVPVLVPETVPVPVTRTVALFHGRRCSLSTFF
jgi:hypothetical protein